MKVIASHAQVIQSTASIMQRMGTRLCVGIRSINARPLIMGC